MGCHAPITQAIVEGGGDYVLALKGNQGWLHHIRTCRRFSPTRRRSGSPASRTMSVTTQKSPLVATVVLPARGCRNQATTPWKRMLSLAVCGLSVGACLVSASREWGSSTGHWWGL